MKKYYYILACVLFVQLAFLVTWYAKTLVPMVALPPELNQEVAKVITEVASIETDLAKKYAGEGGAAFAKERQVMYAKQIEGVRAQLRVSDSLRAEEYRLLVQTAILTLINANIDFTTEEARNNYTEAFTIGYTAYKDARITPYYKEEIITALHDALFNSSWKFDWFLAAAKDFDGGALLGNVKPAYTLAEGDVWRNDHFLGIDGMLVPFGVPMSSLDATWHNDRLMAEAIFKKLIADIGNTAPYTYTLPVANILTMITLHELDNPRLAAQQQKDIEGRLATQAQALDTAYKNDVLSEEVWRLRARAWYFMISYSLRQTIPKAYTAIPDIDEGFGLIIPAATKVSKDIGSYSIEYWLLSYYAVLKSLNGATHDDLASILYFLKDTPTVEKGIGYAANLRSRDYLPNGPLVIDSVRPFLYYHAFKNMVAQKTLTEFGWDFRTLPKAP